MHTAICLAGRLRNDTKAPFLLIEVWLFTVGYQKFCNIVAQID